jgi:hypothetical protein
MAARVPRLPRLPQLLDRKIYKSGQTRGADNDEIFQNRVGRNSTVLIPHAFWPVCRPENNGPYENGYVVLVQPSWYFQQEDPTAALAAEGLAIGTNALVFYQRRSDWLEQPPANLGWTVATSRLPPLGGHYVARVAATTAADGGERINLGFTTTAQKGLGIRVYEYAPLETIRQTRVQLEALFWMSRDAIPVIAVHGMTLPDAEVRAEAALMAAEATGLLEMDALRANRMISRAGITVCPLCLEELSPIGFVSRLSQAEGREVHDLTVTEVSLFHIEELRVGQLLHRPYNLGWGHHHCNVVARDAGIAPTIEWMRGILERNDAIR